MPEERHERTREAYRCGRSFILVPWQHCDCTGCKFARLMHARMRAGLAPDGKPYGASLLGPDWFSDPSSDVLRS